MNESTVPATAAPAAKVVIAARADALPHISAWLAGSPAHEVTATVTDPDSDPARLAGRGTDVFVVDRALSDAFLFGLLDQLRHGRPTGVVVVLSEFDPEFERKALRAGALELLRTPLDGAAADALAEAVHEVRRRRDLHASAFPPPADEIAAPPPAPARPQRAAAPLIALISAKGGVGRSFVAANLASVLAQKRTVALCDLDLQFSDLSTWGVEQPPERTIDQLAAVVAAGEVQLADVQAVAETRFGGVTLLPGTRSPVEGATWAAERGVRALRLAAALRRWYGAVVVDSLPGLLEPVVGIARSASLLVVVTTCEVGTLRATKRYLELLDRYAPTPRLVVANRANRGLSAKLVRATLGASERLVFLKEDRTFARRLVVEGLAASQQRGRGVSRTFNKLAATVATATAAPSGGG